MPEVHPGLDELFQNPDRERAHFAQGKSPLKCLDPYIPEDRDILFGRDLEIREIYSRFYKSLFLLDYGESGGGQGFACAVRSVLGSAQEEAHFVTMRAALNPVRQLRSELHRKAPGLAQWDEEEAELQEVLAEAIFLTSKTLVLLFDQFEELFIFQDSDTRSRMYAELEALLRSELNVRVVICVCEEYLAKLYEAKERIPHIFDNDLWVRRASGSQARSVTQNTQQWSIRYSEASCVNCSPLARAVGPASGLPGRMTMRSMLVLHAVAE